MLPKAVGCAGWNARLADPAALQRLFKKIPAALGDEQKGRLSPNLRLHMSCLCNSHQQFSLADLWSWLRFMAEKQNVKALGNRVGSCPRAKSCPYRRAGSQVPGCRRAVWAHLPSAAFCDSFNSWLSPAGLLWALVAAGGTVPTRDCCAPLATSPARGPWSLVGKACLGFVLLKNVVKKKKEKGRGLQKREVS